MVLVRSNFSIELQPEQLLSKVFQRKASQPTQPTNNALV